MEGGMFPEPITTLLETLGVRATTLVMKHERPNGETATLVSNQGTLKLHLKGMTGSSLTINIAPDQLMIDLESVIGAELNSFNYVPIGIIHNSILLGDMSRTLAEYNIQTDTTLNYILCQMGGTPKFYKELMD
jgi:hypothetical protein